MSGVEVEEATPEEAVRMAASLIRQAVAVDSVDHCVAHLESALIWLRGLPPDEVRRLWPLTAAQPGDGGDAAAGGGEA